ncbi:MAG: DUF4132 domain-containing protein [Planctomycetota bacterium]
MTEPVDVVQAALSSLSLDGGLQVWDNDIGPYVEMASGLNADGQADLVVLLIEAAAAEVAARIEVEARAQDPQKGLIYAYRFMRCSDLASRLLRRKLPWSADRVVAALNGICETRGAWALSKGPVTALVRAVEKHWAELRAEPRVIAALEAVSAHLSKSARLQSKTPLRDIAQLLGGETSLDIEPGEAWADAVIESVRQLTGDRKRDWCELIAHCGSTSGAKPSAKWIKKASELIERIGRESVDAAILDWLPLVDKPRTQVMMGPAYEWIDGRYEVRQVEIMRDQIIDPHMDVLKGLCWIASQRESEAMARVLGALAVSCYRKVPGVGPRAVRVGNAAVNALGWMPGRGALGQLAMLVVKVKFGTAQKLINKALDAAAEREGLPRDEIEEMAVPSYGLDEVGLAEQAMGEHTAVLAVTGTVGAKATTLTWRNAKGKASKSVPAAVKRDHAEDLKELKASIKDIQKMLPAQRDRIDALFLERKTWAMPTWRERYLDHPLVGTLARRMVWLLNDGDHEVAAAWLAEDPDGPAHGPGGLVDVEGKPIEIDPEATTVSLWHPISPDAQPGSTETRDDVLTWRSFFEDRGIQQPFKQAHREVYLLTDAERNTEVYSNRFAAHVIRQHQFHALAAQRGWKNRLRLMVDDEYPPAHRVLETWGLRAEFWIEGVGDDWHADYVLDSGAFRYLATDQVRFYDIRARQNSAHAGGGRYEMWGSGDDPENHPLRIDRVPPIVLSEVLRDVDLFVGVGSIGNNPEWQDGGPDGAFRDYWQSYSFGELSGTAKTRRDFLQRIVPRLKIADACTVTDKFLVVLGKKRTYKIHLGSGNILMEPNDQYLCIVPNSSMEAGPKGQKLFLPFEGDRTLAIILSKAFLLAADDKITDRTILSQINR